MNTRSVGDPYVARDGRRGVITQVDASGRFQVHYPGVLASKGLTLHCAVCSRGFTLIGGLGEYLVEEATRPECSHVAEAVRQYAGAFDVDAEELPMDVETAEQFALQAAGFRPQDDLKLVWTNAPPGKERTAAQAQPERKKVHMALEIQTAADITAPWTVWFLYGALGSGKTRAASTFRAPLFLVPANEGSELTLRQLADKNLPFIRIGKRMNGQVVPARAHMSEVLSELEKMHAEMLRLRNLADKASGDEQEALYAKADAAFPWQTIVVESLTHLGDLLVEDVSDYGKKKMDQQQWGLISTFFRTVHSRLRGMDAHIVYTALAKAQESDSGSITSGGPNLIGQMAEKLPSQCDVVAYLEELQYVDKTGAQQNVHRVYFRKYKYWLARTRFANFPAYVDNFNFADFEEKLA